MTRVLVILSIFVVLALACASLAFQPRSGNPALDGKDYLLSEADFRAIIAATRAWLTRTHPSFSVRRVHVITRDRVEVYVRGRLNSSYGENSDLHSVDLERAKRGWRIGAHNLDAVPTID